jgi:hypothetical protein
MKLIVCIENRNGLTFNHRRVSRDKELCQNLLELVGGKKLYMSPYSRGLFSEEKDNLLAVENYLEAALEEDYCFFETGDMESYMEKVTEVYLYRWNRDYPADEFFYLDEGFWLEESIDFEGNSHPLITREHYKR